MAMLDSSCMQNLKLKKDLTVIARKSDRRDYSRKSRKPDLKYFIVKHPPVLQNFPPQKQWKVNFAKVISIPNYMNFRMWGLKEKW